MSQFADRTDAGRRLGERLAARGLHDPVVLGLPRGGVPVAAEVARILGAPLDVLVVRKVGAPGNPEYAAAAVGEGGVVAYNDRALRGLGLEPDDLQESVDRERQELERRLRRYRDARPAEPLDGRTAVVVDDGIATGSTASAAGQVLRERDVGSLVLAVPVGPPESLERVGADFDDVVAVLTPEAFMAVGSFYRDFGQTSDDTVVEILRRMVS